MMTYEEAIGFVEEARKRGSVLGLSNMRALMEELGNPQNTIPTIHIAGTNGKGSVGAYLASICKEAHFKVGRYCSPAVFDPLECWQFDGRCITKEEYANALSQVKAACDIVMSKGFEPTAFEIETALAFVYFAEMKPDVLLLECGMGGETDATNVVDNPIACVFTSISYDHMQYLGNSLTEIARVKAGIMKPGSMVFWGRQEPEVEAVLEEKLKEVTALGEAMGLETTQGDVYHSRVEVQSVTPGELRFSYLGVNYMTRMAGLYQVDNAVLAIAVFDALWPKLLFGLQDEMEMWEDKEAPIAGWLDMEYASRAGILFATWPGRFEVLGDNPLVIVDGAHNAAAAQRLAETLEKGFTNQDFVYIIGVLADKEHEKMLEIMLPFAKRVYTITPDNARALDGKLLAEEARGVVKKLGDVSGSAQNINGRSKETIIENRTEVVVCDSIVEAVDFACAYGKEENLSVLAFGSLSYLGELREAYYKKYPITEA